MSWKDLESQRFEERVRLTENHPEEYIPGAEKSTFYSIKYAMK
jgi:hypothetical protein